MSDTEKVRSSFRDPNGFLFTRGKGLFRQVNQIYQENYNLLMSSGLYDALTKENLLVMHHEVDEKPADPSQAFRVLQPEMVNFISYPYEWSFSQYQDAARVTLEIMKLALEHGMVLKDASAYNIQFHRGKPLIIDTLSFEKYSEGLPWVAYRQFCQHFLAPLALMEYTDVRLSQLMRVYIDGIPLDLASTLLPPKTKFNLGLQAHIHLHATVQKRYAGKEVKQAARERKMSKTALTGLISSLDTTVKNLAWKPEGTEWADYYSDTNYSGDSFNAKKKLLEEFILLAKPQKVWDLGSNTGIFSRVVSDKGIPVISFDIDPAAVEINYQEMRNRKETGLLPLVLDLTNPSPSIGWANQERQSLHERGPVDMVLALALIHHLAISNNVPLITLAEFFSDLSRHLIIEFVPKEDSQVQRLLVSREDIFPEYHREGFERAFKTCFQIAKVLPIPGTQRTLYLMERR